MNQWPSAKTAGSFLNLELDVFTWSDPEFKKSQENVNVFLRYFAADTVWAEKDDNTNGKQFGMIIASVVVTMAISFITGLINGKFIEWFLYWLSKLICANFLSSLFGQCFTTYIRCFNLHGINWNCAPCFSFSPSAYNKYK